MSEPKIRLTQISPSATGTDSISGNVTITNDLTVGGNLTVSGDTTTLNVQTLLVEDNEIILNSNVTGSPSLNASVTINRGSSSNAFLLWNEGTDKWGWSDDGNTVTEFATAVLKTGDTMTGQLNISSGGLLVTGNVGIGIADTANASLTILGDSPDPFNTPINILKLVTSAGNQGSSARIDMQVGAARPYIEALVTGPNSGNGAALAFATANSSGVGTEKVRITTDGNVGIGTTNPGSKFSITNSVATAYSSINTLTSGQTARISNDNTGSNVAATLIFEATGGGGGNGLGTISGVNTGTGSLALTFGTRNSGGNVEERMRIISNGYVGIGITNPLTPLHINKSAATQVLRVDDSTQGSGTTVLANFTNTSDMDFVIGVTQSTASSKYAFIGPSVSSGNLILNPTNTGYVGIGTTNPSTVLTISKAIDSAAYGSGTRAIDFKTYFPGFDVDGIKSAIYSGVSDKHTLNTFGGFMAFYVNQSGFAGSGSGTNLIEALRIEKDGNVGIGTTNPGAKLHISNGSSTAYLRITGRDRETYFGQDSLGCAVYSSNNVPMYFVTNDIERVRITGDGSFGITQTPGKYTIDTTGGQTTIAGSGTVDFPNCSGMLVVNNHSNGRVTIYLCGGSLTTVVASVVGQCGTFAYNVGIAGYTWTNDSSTAVFGFFFVRTRPTA